MRRAFLLLLLASLVACAVKQTHPVSPPSERYILPLAIPPEAIFCVETHPGFGSCIKVEDLRKLLESMGKA
jgi:hypothetical protein